MSSMNRLNLLLVRPVSLAAMVLLIGLLAGCGIVGGKDAGDPSPRSELAEGEPVPPDYLRVTAIGEPVTVEEGGWPAQFRGIISASAGEDAIDPAYVPNFGTDSVIATANTQSTDSLTTDSLTTGTLALDAATTAATALKISPEMDLLMRRAALRREALRALADRILSTTDTGTHTLSEQLAEDPDRRTALNRLLEARAEVVVQADRSPMSAEALIQGATIVDELALYPAGQLQPDEETLRKRARERGLELAKEQLREQLMDVDLGNGRVARDVFEDHPDALRQLNALIFLIQPDDIVYRADQSAEVTIFFDRNLVRRIAERQRGGFLSRLWPF